MNESVEIVSVKPGVGIRAFLKKRLNIISKTIIFSYYVNKVRPTLKTEEFELETLDEWIPIHFEQMARNGEFLNLNIIFLSNKGF